MASFGHDIIFIVEISFFGDRRMLYRMAGYCRLSKEDGENRISESIENQKKLILEYVDKAGDMQLVRMYVDATDIIGLKQNPTNGRRFSPIFLCIGHFSE